MMQRCPFGIRFCVGNRRSLVKQQFDTCSVTRTACDMQGSILELVLATDDGFLIAIEEVFQEHVSERLTILAGGRGGVWIGAFQQQAEAVDMAAPSRGMYRGVLFGVSQASG